MFWLIPICIFIVCTIIAAYVSLSDWNMGNALAGALIFWMGVAAALGVSVGRLISYLF